MIDCSGLFHEDESEDCLQKRQHTCKDWWAGGKKKTGAYLIDLYLNGKIFYLYIFQKIFMLLLMIVLIRYLKKNQSHFLFEIIKNT